MCVFLPVCLSAMSKAAVKISADLLSNPLCEQDQAFLESMTALDTTMKRMDSFNQEKVRLSPTVFYTWMCLSLSCHLSFSWHSIDVGEIFPQTLKVENCASLGWKCIFSYSMSILYSPWPKNYPYVFSFCCFWKASVSSSTISWSYWLSAVKTDAFVTHWCLK